MFFFLCGLSFLAEATSSQKISAEQGTTSETDAEVSLSPAYRDSVISQDEARKKHPLFFWMKRLQAETIVSSEWMLISLMLLRGVFAYEVLSS